MQVIQYIDLVNPNSVASAVSTSQGDVFPLIPPDDFGEDEAAGHGTHTAGSAAGATLNTPAEPLTCSTTQTLGCVGACLDNDAMSVDDLVATSLQLVDIDRFCPIFGCEDDPRCLGEDVSETLTENGGMAQGAKLSIFDVFFGDYALTDVVGNGLWEPCMEAGCKIHSNSLGGDTFCQVTSTDLAYDEFMYEVRGAGVLTPTSSRHLFPQH